MKLAIIIPYKNRPEYLEILLQHLPAYLDRSGKTDYSIVISEQLDDTLFNRGMSANVGSKYAIEILGAEHLIVHDVDIIPVENVDYSYYNIFLSWFVSAGGVNCLASDYLKLNGYCNSYVGWGDEDVDLVQRAHFYGVEIKEWKKVVRDQDYRPTLVNMEYKSNWDSQSSSMGYWGAEWPRFLKPSEHNLPQISVDKNHNWALKEYTKANWKRREKYSALSKQDRNNHYQSSGINQLKGRVQGISGGTNIYRLSYTTEEAVQF